MPKKLIQEDWSDIKLVSPQSRRLKPQFIPVSPTFSVHSEWTVPVYSAQTGELLYVQHTPVTRDGGFAHRGRARGSY